MLQERRNPRPLLTKAEENRPRNPYTETAEATDMAESTLTSQSRKRRRHTSRGQALIELALILPLLLLLIVNVVNFGGLLYAWITVSNAARAGAQYSITG